MSTNPSFLGKIVGLDRLKAVVLEARRNGRRTVHCHGCFDIVHPGHIRYLEFARQQGDVLIVSLTGDRDVDKGGQRPFIPQELRAENLAALMCVDFVYINPEATAETLLDAIRPEVYVKGSEYEHATDAGFRAEKGVVERYGGRIIFSSGEVVFSSTALLEHMPRTMQAESHRLKLACRRHDISAVSVEQVLDRFRNMHVVVVGDVILDKYVLCDAQSVARESPMLSLTHRDERVYVGGAAIIARHVAALGGHAFLLTSGPTGEAAACVTRVLDTEGVDAHLIDARPSFVEKTRFLAEDTKLFKLDRGQRLPLDSVAERRAALILEQHAKLADAVILCDFGYGMITSTLLERVLPTLRQNVRILTADVSGGRGSLLEFKNVDLLCPTEREVRTTLNDHDSGLSAVAWTLLQRTQARRLFVTLQKRGLVVFDRRSQDRDSPDWSGRLHSEQLSAFAEHGVDFLGCGDALLATATMAMAAGGDAMHAAYLGNAAAAIQAATLGNHPLDVDRLREWLSTRPELLTPTSSRSADSVTVLHDLDKSVTRGAVGPRP